MATTAYSSVTAVEPIAQMRWGAIIAGWFVATGIAILLYGAGIALGFTAFDPHNVQAAAKGLGIGTIVWMVLTWAASLFVGGLFASWFDGRADETMGTLHGVTVWGLAITTSALWLALTLGQVSHGARPMHDDAGRGGANIESVSNEPLAVLRSNVDHALATPGDSQAEKAVMGALMAGHPDTARAILMAQTDMSGDAATARVNAWLPIVNAARDQLKSDADRARHYAAAGMLTLLLSGLAGLLAAALGGWAGAGHIHRVYHLRRYEGRPYQGQAPG